MYGLCAGYIGGKAAYVPLEFDAYIDFEFDFGEDVGDYEYRRKSFGKVADLIVGCAENVLDRPRLREQGDGLTIGELEPDEIPPDATLITSIEELIEAITEYMENAPVFMEKKRSGAYWRSKAKRRG
jgi:hypothetical protein